MRWATRADARVFFGEDPLGWAVFEAVAGVIDECGGAELRVAATQVGWARSRGFAFLWKPQRWLGGRAAPLVLSVDLPDRDPSERWKQAVEVRRDHWMHHLEIRSAADVDDEARGWVSRAYRCAA